MSFFNDFETMFECFFTEGSNTPVGLIDDPTDREVERKGRPSMVYLPHSCLLCQVFSRSSRGKFGKRKNDGSM